MFMLYLMSKYESLKSDRRGVTALEYAVVAAVSSDETEAVISLHLVRGGGGGPVGQNGMVVSARRPGEWSAALNQVT
jgi:Flp pilus assembly pilin Flp